MDKLQQKFELLKQYIQDRYEDVADTDDDPEIIESRGTALVRYFADKDKVNEYIASKQFHFVLHSGITHDQGIFCHLVSGSEQTVDRLLNYLDLKLLP